MIAALLAKPHTIEFRGERITVRRPTVADLVACVDAGERGLFLPAWMVLNHVMDGDCPAFESIEQVMRLDGPSVIELGQEIDKLYSEGLDSRRLPAKSCEQP